MFTLEGQQIVIAGTFAGVDAEDAKWKLIERGARVMTSVTKATALVVLGTGAKKNVLAGLEKHATPTTDEAGLLRLMEGAKVADVLRGTSEAGGAKSSASPAPFAGRKVAFDGRFVRQTKATMKVRLEALGAQVVKVGPKADLLVLGEAWGFDGIDALDAGVPAVFADGLDALEAGAPLSDFVAPRGAASPDAKAACEAVLRSAHDAMLAINLGGERWDDELRVVVHPDGRLAAKLRELGGTPTEDHVRRVLWAKTWPAVDRAVEL
ncbi:MAG: hypothetical protein KC586_11240, partial [Myxococcales bacterium]|nr:hypothetical protein [Myxococcales bacterium]